MYSKSIKIKPGQSLILPQGKYHCFKKINRREPIKAAIKYQWTLVLVMRPTLE
jgi:mannose-6-phosphate isomerase-like protein (cupin superfamily)